jgi:hypothetical protein
MNPDPTRPLASTLLLLLLALPASADKVYVDYDHDVDFSTFATFTYAPAAKGLLAQEELTDQRIVEGIVEHLVAGGLEQVDEQSEPDLVVTYQLATQTNLRADVTAVVPVGPLWGGGWGWGPAFGPGWGWDGGVWYTASTMVTQHRSGVLLVAAFDTRTKRGIWRGTAEIEQQSTPYKTHQKIDQALDKMAEKWRKMHGAD